MELTQANFSQSIQFDERGLIPSIVQDWRDGTVLMLGFMNREAIEETLRTRHVHFWSRSRDTLWRKGETSGNSLLLKQMFVDCDSDTVLIKAEPIDPTCHTGNPSCFFHELLESHMIIPSPLKKAHGGILDRLYDLVQERKAQPSPNSYVASLLEGQTDRILKKIAEESGEVLLAAKNANREEIVYEVADLLFHTVVMLGKYDIPPEEVYRELGRRFGQSGLKKKTKEGIR